jgi:predicted anti-sigma-YlaC factor YlaD
MELTCESLEALLPEMIDGRLGKEEEMGAATHLATCESCRLIVDETNQVRVAAREYGRVEMPDDVRARIRGSLEEEQARG